MYRLAYITLYTVHTAGNSGYMHGINSQAPVAYIRLPILPAWRFSPNPNIFMTSCTMRQARDFCLILVILVWYAQIGIRELYTQPISFNSLHLAPLLYCLDSQPTMHH